MVQIVVFSYVHSELYEYLEYEILNLVVHTKICTNENYPLYSSHLHRSGEDKGNRWRQPYGPQPALTSLCCYLAMIVGMALVWVVERSALILAADNYHLTNPRKS